MVTNTQFFNGCSGNSSLIQSSVNSESGSSKKQNSAKLSNTNSSYDNIISNNNKVKSNTVNKKDFSEVLKSKKQSKVSDNDSKKSNKKSMTDSNKSSSIDKLKSKIEELKEKVEDGNCDEKEVNDILAELLNALNNLTEKNDLTKIMKPENTNEVVQSLVETITNNDDKNTVLQQLLETISSDDSKNSFGSDLLKDMKDLLQQLSASLKEDSNESMKKGINDIVSKLQEMLQESDDQGKNMITTEGLFKQDTSKQDNNSGMLDKKNDSKEDKFLNSLIDDKKDTVDNKINLFATRNQNIQVQNGQVRGLNINKVTFVNDVIKDVKYMSVNNIKELTVKVNPGNLGEITIKLVQEDGLMKANLRANSKETAALLSQNLAEIKKELVEQNIKISEVNIELYNEDTTFFKNESFGGQLSQEQNENRNTSRNNGSTSINVSEVDDELENDNLVMLNNNLDFLA
ncbi:MAG: flagellar hook-length control protein FliK [Romboutsia sp.]|nr:flagellar hook-length control protein FliK [Romboutsia sp.]